MTYVPPNRRSDYNPNAQPFHPDVGYVGGGANVPRLGDTHHAQFQRAFHGDRRIQPHGHHHSPTAHQNQHFLGDLHSHEGHGHHQHHHRQHHQHQDPFAHGSGQGGGGQGFFGGHHQQQPQHQHQQQQQQFQQPVVPHIRQDVPDEKIFEQHSFGINFDKYERIEVHLHPNDIIPAQNFDDMGVVEPLLENVRRCQYQKPTPIQKYGIPVVMQGKDLMACAQTGSGKTAAYLLPAANFTLCNSAFARGGRPAYPTTLIMGPTRELCIQIYEEGRKFTYRTGMRCVVLYGGADPRHQITELMRGCNLLVATPGRLWDMFERGYVSFQRIQFLVLDEADRMLDMGFEPQIRKLIEGNDTDMTPVGQRQTLMYSATFPREIQKLAREFLHSHYFLSVGRVGSTTENITQDVRWVEDIDKRDELFKLLLQFSEQLVLVFVEKKRDADYLERQLRNHYRVACTSIHGERTQREREEALAYFKSGMIKALIATDVASRGLDIPDVAAVVQFDMPSNIDDYVHRIGRTARAGKLGLAISFFNEKNKNIVKDLLDTLKETNQVVPDFIATMSAQMRPQRTTITYGRAGGWGGGRGGSYRGRGTFGGGNFGGAGFAFGAHPGWGSHGQGGHHYTQQFHQHASVYRGGHGGGRGLFQPKGGHGGTF